MKVFITGITGFVGRYLAEYLLEKKNIIVGGTSFLETPIQAQKLFSKNVHLYKIDLLDRKKLNNVIKSFKPDVIFHLAGVSSTSNSWKNAEYTLKNNIFSQLNILNAAKDICPKSRIIIISSAQVYGSVSSKNLPLREESFPRPNNPYSVSKLTQEMLGYQYFDSFGLDVVILRPSNHIGPRQEGNFVVPRFTKQIADIENNKTKPIMTVGDLNTSRDFTDVRDIVKAYFLAIKKAEKGGIYNLSSNTSISIKEILKILLSFSIKSIKIVKDKKYLRPSDIDTLEIDSSKFRKISGWKPKITLKKTLKDALDYYREIK